jgi:hypothetical protein
MKLVVRDRLVRVSWAGACNDMVRPGAECASARRPAGEGWKQCGAQAGSCTSGQCAQKPAQPLRWPCPADPHPGNLIRTPDGRLAILDFGLMTQISDNVKVSRPLACCCIPLLLSLTVDCMLLGGVVLSARHLAFVSA